MDLKEILRESKGVLSHAELNFYIGYVAFADNETGFCYPMVSTVAESVGVSKQSASRLYKKLIKSGWLEKVKGGFFCRIGFGESKPNVNFSKHSVNSESKPDVNFSKHSVNRSKRGVNSHRTNHRTNHITNQKEESAETAPHQKQTFDSVQFHEPDAPYLPADEIAESEAVALFEQTFRVTAGIHFAATVASHVQNLDVWEKLLISKAAFADDPPEKRNRISRWIISAYDELLKKEDKSNEQYRTAREKQNDTAIENYNFIEQFSAYAEQQKSGLHSQINENHKLLN